MNTKQQAVYAKLVTAEGNDIQLRVLEMEDIKKANLWVVVPYDGVPNIRCFRIEGIDGKKFKTGVGLFHWESVLKVIPGEDGETLNEAIGQLTETYRNETLLLLEKFVDEARSLAGLTS